jgi:hypothetical protein
LRADHAHARPADRHLVRHAGRGPPLLRRRRSARLGHKALAVNLSDLAAMGARPVGFTWRWRCRKPAATGCTVSRKACSRWPMPSTSN